MRRLLGAQALPGGPLIAALFVEKGGVYYGLPDVDPWDLERDARLYAGPWPVVAHPPCERWGEQWHACRPVGHPKRGVLGDDGGCFESALRKVRHLACGQWSKSAMSSMVYRASQNRIENLLPRPCNYASLLVASMQNHRLSKPAPPSIDAHARNVAWTSPGRTWRIDA